MKPSMQWSFLLVFVKVSAFGIMLSDSYPKFTSSSALRNIEVDSKTGDVYLGGVNTLIKLSSNLKVMRNVTTGPKLDNPGCAPPEYETECSKTRTPTDNVNKILAIDQEGNQIITCGSIFYGVCELRDLASLALKDPSAIPGYFLASVKDKPAVGMVAPSKFGIQKFYVGAKWTKAAQDLISLVDLHTCVSRDIDSSFGLYEGSALYSSVDVKKEELDNWEIMFKYIFSSNSFTYFVMSIGQSYKTVDEAQVPVNNIKRSEISRVCQKNGGYKSYVQIPLECMSTSGTNYNLIQSAFVSKAGGKLAASLGIKANDDVLFAVFSKSDSSYSHTASKHSALCVYSMKEIDKIFSENIKLCVTESVSDRGLPWVDRGGSETCQKDAISNYNCQEDMSAIKNYPIGGNTSVKATPVLENSVSKLTAVVATDADQFTAVFLGMENGHLLKVSLTDKSKIHIPYEDVNLFPGISLQKLAFSSDKTFIFPVAGKQVAKMPLHECEKYTSCDTCAGKGDAFCGWCTLESRCTVKSKCAKSDLTSRFVQTAEKCVKFSIKPDQVPRGQIVQLELTMTNLPSLSAGNTYTCYINGKPQVTGALSGNKIQCKTPGAADLPQITSDTGDVKVDLGLYSSETKKMFAATKVSFYDCARISNCLACSEGEYSCDWCVYKGQCSATGSSSCDAGDILVKYQQKRVAGDQSCPYLTANQELLVPSGVPTSFAVKGMYLPSEKAGYGYQCRVTVGGDTQTTGAVRDSDTTLTCQDAKVRASSCCENIV